MVPYDLHYDFLAPKNTVFHNGEANNNLVFRDVVYLNSLYTFPISLQKTILNPNKKYKYNHFEIGVKLNRVVAIPYIISSRETHIIDGESYEFFEYQMYGTQKNIFSYFVKAGIVKINKKLNTFHINGVLHFSPKRIGIGEYEFHNLNAIEVGQISRNINYIGVEFVYGMTLFKDK